MKKFIVFLSLNILTISGFNDFIFAQGSILSNETTTINTIASIEKIDILQEGINENNAGLILSQRIFTDGNLELNNQKFEILKGINVALDGDVKNSLNLSNKTRNNYKLAKKNLILKQQ